MTTMILIGKHCEVCGKPHAEESTFRFKREWNEEIAALCAVCDKSMRAILGGG